VLEGAGGERTGSRFAAIRARWISRSDGTSTPGMRVAELGVTAIRAGMRYRSERMATMVVCVGRLNLSMNRLLGRTELRYLDCCANEC
jgi:hypothetical protein